MPSPHPCRLLPPVRPPAPEIDVPVPSAMPRRPRRRDTGRPAAPLHLPTHRPRRCAAGPSAADEYEVMCLYDDRDEAAGPGRHRRRAGRSARAARPRASSAPTRTDCSPPWTAPRRQRRRPPRARDGRLFGCGRRPRQAGCGSRPTRRRRPRTCSSSMASSSMDSSAMSSMASSAPAAEIAADDPGHRLAGHEGDLGVDDLGRLGLELGQR